MPAESKTAAATPPKSRPTTRTSIRQSLNLASMSKALVDVISKDIKDSTKNARKPKDSSRRSSTLSSQPPPHPTAAAPRLSMGEVRPPSQVSKRTGTPESRTITRKRVSGSYTRSSSEEQYQHQHKTTTYESGTPQSSVQRASSILRSKNVVNATSALPKYRPKTNANDPPAQKPPSPVKAGTRRRLSSSEDEKKEQNFALSPVDKSSRPISPLPHRAALKTNVNSINVTPPPATPSKTKAIVSPSSVSRLSPVRPTKIVKTSTAIPRPPSSTSSVSSLQPSNTPKSTKIVTPTAERNSKFGFPRSGNNVKKSGGTPSKLIHPTFTRDSPSPLSRLSGQSLKTTPNSSMASGNMSHISEGASESEDSDLENVELLLAPVAAMGAPTPAMPRIQASKKRGNPQTPSKPSSKSRLPSREDLSYISPEPPNSDKRYSSLRPPVHSDAPRGSILSWEQLAAEASRTIGEDEFGRMLADVSAPFHSGAASPALSSHIGLPDSPGLSIIDSPGGGFGSISQVLLPDVTPSPAVNHNIQQSKFHLTPDASKSAVDASTATLLRLQLASVENTARERLRQLQAMEEEIHNIKQAHAQQTEEMQKQVQYMETQSRLNDERVSDMFKASLEGQFRQQRAAHEEAFRQFQDNAKLMHNRVLDTERVKMTAASSASLAASKWGTVASIGEAELNHVRADRGMLAFLLAQVDEMSIALN